MEKYKLRVGVGRRTGRMDLSSRMIWAAESSATSKAGSFKTPTITTAANSASSESKVDAAANKDGFDLSEVADAERVPGGEGEAALTASEEVDRLLDQAERHAAQDEEEEALMFAAADEQPPSLDDRPSAIRAPEKPGPPLVDFRLTIIPSEVLRLSELNELWLCNNMIASVPSAIGDLKQLRVLSLTGNRLDSLPPEICLLENLRQLLLRGNKLTSLPNLLGRLRQLRELNAADNQFADFPEVLTSLPQLALLDLSGNHIASPLPASLTEMRCLTLLSLEHNRLGPTSCAVLARTPWIDVQGCVIPVSKKASHEFEITPAEQFELLGMLKNRANVAIATNLRRKKLRGMQSR